MTIDISTIANIIIAVATFGMALAAWFAVHTWRKEFIGKKKIELAYEIMMTVMEFQDVLINARINMHTPQELDAIKKWLEEVNSKKQNIPNSILWPIYIDRMWLLAPFHRLNQSLEKTKSFDAIRNKSLIHFGEELYKLLFELYSYLGKIRHASETLYENPSNVELQQTAFFHDATDPVSKRIFEIGEEIKLNLEPIYKDQQVKWKKLKPLSVDSKLAKSKK